MRSAITLNDKAIVSSKGQVVIPRALREAMGIHAGTELIFSKEKEDTIQIKIQARKINHFFGRGKGYTSKPLSLEEMDAAIMQAVLDNDKQAGDDKDDRR
jgi:AbrB family looped-hinge helix DNA binding protein